MGGRTHELQVAVHHLELWLDIPGVLWNIPSLIAVESNGGGARFVCVELRRSQNETL